MSLVAYDDSSNDSDSSNSLKDERRNCNDIKQGKDAADIIKGKSNSILMTANDYNRLNAIPSNILASASQLTAIVKNSHTINDKEVIREQNAGKKTTKIYISKLASFSDVKDVPRPNKIRQTGSSLLQMLPKPKIEAANNISQQQCSTIPASNNNTTAPIAFIPDVIKYKRPTYNTENVDQICDKFPLKKLKLSNKNIVETTNSCYQNTDSKNSICDTNVMNFDNNNDTTKAIKHNSNNDKEDDAVESDNEHENDDGKKDGNENGNDNDDECTDYFALNDKHELPEINQNELETTISPALPAPKLGNFHANPQPASSLAPQILDKNAMTALHGSAAKRQQARYENIKFIDISSNEVHPDRTEWMRNAMKSSTNYEPTGVLLDEEPAAGTRRKHQITYLAHKAKANEAELQAMWSANRHTRRVTQNKYGF